MIGQYKFSSILIKLLFLSPSSDCPIHPEETDPHHGPKQDGPPPDDPARGRPGGRRGQILVQTRPTPGGRRQEGRRGRRLHRSRVQGRVRRIRARQGAPTVRHPGLVVLFRVEGAPTVRHLDLVVFFRVGETNQYPHLFHSVGSFYSDPGKSLLIQTW